jgi:alginate O-acetyltransferase complex protein AlgI
MGLTFTSLEFIFFLGVCLVLLHASGRLSARTWLLIIFSCLFYLTFGVGGVLVVTFTAVADFIVGRRVGNTSNEVTRKRWLWVGLAANLGPLVFLKYSGFLVEIIAAFLHPLGVRVSPSGHPVFSIIGLSYFTFAGMSYVLDVYWETMEPARCLSEFFCYLVYFPKLIAGPIVRAADFLPQFSQGFKITAQDFEIGCGYLLVGAVKKLVIADQLASHVSMIMAAPQQFNAWTLVQGMIGYTVQIYADFSGYSDMAIGCARLMGVKFPQNFLMPYSSVNIAEFWRRWHVTMSTWFRDYVFLPLEFGSRRTRNANVRASRNIFVTMLLCGLWHGASWNFVAWGGLHGVALAVYQVYKSLRRRKVPQLTRSAFHPGTLVSRVLTLSVVMVGWIFFGTESLAVGFKYLWRMVTWNTDGVALGSPYILPLAALMFLVHLLINKDRNVIEELSNYSLPSRVLTYTSLLLALALLVPSDTVPFAYVRF